MSLIIRRESSQGLETDFIYFYQPYFRGGILGNRRYQRDIWRPSLEDLLIFKHSRNSMFSTFKDLRQNISNFWWIEQVFKFSRSVPFPSSISWQVLFSNSARKLFVFRGGSDCSIFYFFDFPMFSKDILFWKFEKGNLIGKLSCHFLHADMLIVFYCLDTKYLVQCVIIYPNWFNRYFVRWDRTDSKGN